MKIFLGLAALGVASPAHAGQVDLKATRLTQRSMKRIVVALEDYRRACGSVPTTEQGLDALVHPPSCGDRKHAPFLRTIGKDAWGHLFTYESDGRTFSLTSYGRDGVEGGTGEDMDIVAH
jgi:general secretion pathway protein G